MTARPRADLAPPGFVEPQLALLVKEPPQGEGWAHEIKFDGYRIEAPIAPGEERSARVKLLTRKRLDWARKYPAVAAALASLPARSVIIDGELCALAADGTTSFAALEAASAKNPHANLVYYAFDLMFLDGEDLRAAPGREQRWRPKMRMCSRASSSIQREIFRWHCLHTRRRGSLEPHGSKSHLEGKVKFFMLDIRELAIN